MVFTLSPNVCASTYAPTLSYVCMGDWKSDGKVLIFCGDTFWKRRKKFGLHALKTPKTTGNFVKTWAMNMNSSRVKNYWVYFPLTIFSAFFLTDRCARRGFGKSLWKKPHQCHADACKSVSHVRILWRLQSPRSQNCKWSLGFNSLSLWNLCGFVVVAFRFDVKSARSKSI